VFYPWSICGSVFLPHLCLFVFISGEKEANRENKKGAANRSRMLGKQLYLAIELIKILDYTTPDRSWNRPPFTEAGNLGTHQVVALLAVFNGVIVGVGVDHLHDVVQTGIDLFSSPGESHAVLAHLETGGGYAARICSLGRTKEDFRIQEELDCFQVGGHVGAFANQDTAVLEQRLGILGVNFVLRGARESALCGNGPGAFACVEFRSLGYLVRYSLIGGRVFLFLISMTQASFSALMPSLS
jgi:hypothetical protein